MIRLMKKKARSVCLKGNTYGDIIPVILYRFFYELYGYSSAAGCAGAAAAVSETAAQFYGGIVGHLFSKSNLSGGDDQPGLSME